MYDKAVVINEEKSNVKISVPHPKVCSLYDFDCKNVMVKPNTLVAIGNIYNDWVFVSALKEDHVVYLRGWVKLDNLKFLQATEKVKKMSNEKLETLISMYIK